MLSLSLTLPQTRALSPTNARSLSPTNALSRPPCIPTALLSYPPPLPLLFVLTTCRYANMIACIIKLIPKLTRDRVRKLIDTRLVGFVVQCLTLIAEMPVDKLIIRSSVMCSILVVSIATETIGKTLLIEGGVLGILPRLLDCPIEDTGRLVGTFCAIATGLLVGREEEKERGLSAKSLHNVVHLVVAALSMAHGKGMVTTKYEIISAVREVSISDRHLAMMLDAGILEAFPLVGVAGFSEWIVGLYPSPIDGKTMDVISWEAVAAIGLNIALMASHTHVLRADDAAMETLKAMAAWPNEPHLKQIVKDAKLAMFELDAASSIQHIATNSGTRASSSVEGDGGGSADDPRKKHVMLSYSWAQQSTVLRLVERMKRDGLKVWVDVECMRGSTIDAMADAVENAAVVLICMSRDYKESSNCRFEGNYVTQQKKPYLCVMVEEGYSPTGWLGIMLGMNLWFGLYVTS